MKQNVLFILLFAFIGCGIPANLFAQISEGGTPASFYFQDQMISMSEKLPYRAPISFDVAKLREEDKIAEINNQPLRTMVIILDDLNMENGKLRIK